MWYLSVSHREPSQTSKINLFAGIIIDGFQQAQSQEKLNLRCLTGF